MWGICVTLAQIIHHTGLPCHMDEHNRITPLLKYSQQNERYYGMSYTAVGILIVIPLAFHILNIYAVLIIFVRQIWCAI